MAYLLVMLFSVQTVWSQDRNNGTDVFYYQKKEINNGVLFFLNNERDELRTDESRFYEKLTTGTAAYQFKFRDWNFMDYKQDFWELSFDAGSFYGQGNWQDSSFTGQVKADHTQYGLRSNLSASYSTRFYYNPVNYTLVEVRGTGRFDLYRKNQEGIALDSLGEVTQFDEQFNETKLNLGFEAKAGWGWGRLNPMNNYMLAEHIMTKYYAGRVFSEKEIRQLANEIYLIKGQRNVAVGHKTDIESEEISDFLREKLLLASPGSDVLENDWQLSEFMPRLNGNRFELGPFFKYYNREPDFIYGGYVTYENAKYCNLKWNRNLGASLRYNHYKKKDWINAEFSMGWSFFPDLKRQFDFAVKYIPGIDLNDFSESVEMNHALIPSVGYYSQINSKSRVNFTFAYRISADEQQVLPGPEFSLSFYRSRY